MVAKNPTVTIGIPVYNGTDYLAETLDSILVQTYTDFEIVISDNGSIDETLDLCRIYAERDSRIRLYDSAINRGARWNYNRVFGLARGSYFRWHGHDDLIEPTYLERCVDVLEKEPDTVIAYPQSAIIDSKSQIIRMHEDNMNLQDTDVSSRMQKFHPGLCHPIFGLMRTEVLKTTDLIGNFIGSDEILLWQLALRGKYHEVPELLFYRRFHEKASVVANPDFRSRSQWFDPKKKNAIYFKRWHHFYLKLRAIHNSPLTTNEKRRVYIQFARKHAAHPGFMIQDFKTLAHHFQTHRQAEKPIYWSENPPA